MSAITILTKLVQNGLTPISACALTGNMMAESTLKSNIAQRGMTSMSDEEYTAAADNSLIDFVHDQVGYGLCQWTYYARKQNLLNYAKSKGKSVGDESLQIEFCLIELQSEYGNLWNYLRTANGLYEATSRICKEYERPAVNNIQTRVEFANQLYMQYGQTLEHVEPNQYNEAMTYEVTTPTPNTLVDLPTVSIDTKIPEVQYLAAKLEEIGYNVIWDGLTACLQDFQAKKGLTVDGICGPRTWSKLLFK